MPTGLRPRRRRHTHTHLSCAEPLEPRALLAGLTGTVPQTVPLAPGGDAVAVTPLLLSTPQDSATSPEASAGLYHVMPLVVTGGGETTMHSGVAPPPVTTSGIT